MIKSRRGVEGLPFKLLITSIIMAVVLPVGYQAYSSYDEGVLVSRIASELSRLVQIVEDAGKSPGNVRFIKMDLTGTMLNQLDYVEIGGEAESGKDMLIRYSIDGTIRNMILENVRACSFDGKTLVLEEGKHSLRIESHMDDRGIIVYLGWE